MLLISGSSNCNLAYNISLILGIKLLNVSLGLFNNGEIKIEIKDTVRGEDIVVIQSGYNSTINVKYHRNGNNISYRRIETFNRQEPITLVMPFICL